MTISIVVLLSSLFIASTAALAYYMHLLSLPISFKTPLITFLLSEHIIIFPPVKCFVLLLISLTKLSMPNPSAYGISPLTHFHDAMSLTYFLLSSNGVTTQRIP